LPPAKFVVVRGRHRRRQSPRGLGPRSSAKLACSNRDWCVDGELMHLSQDPRGSCFVQSCCILFKIRAREWVRAGLGLAVLVQSLLLDVLFLSLVRRLDPRVCLRVSDMCACECLTCSLLCSPRAYTHRSHVGFSACKYACERAEGAQATYLLCCWRSCSLAPCLHPASLPP
jgi:hypothetical protein